jgi:hypothetical protein
MGQFSIQSQPSAAGTNAQTVAVPPQTSKVNSVQSTNQRILNNLEARKRGTKRKIPLMRKGLPLPKLPRREALRRKGKLISLHHLWGGPSHSPVPSKDEIHRYLAQQWAPPNNLLY